MADDDAFLSRWARRKALVRQGVQPPDPSPPGPQARPSPTGTVAPAGVGSAGAPTPALAAASATQETRKPDEPAPTAPAPPAPTLDDVARLTPDAPDFSRFVAPGVGTDVKNAALKKLFADPHFNVMDGLDIYIDDYSKPDPLPKAMLRQMVQGRFLGLFDDEPEKPADNVPDDELQARVDAAAPPTAADPSAPAQDRPAATEALSSPTDAVAAGPTEDAAPDRMSAPRPGDPPAA